LRQIKTKKITERPQSAVVSHILWMMGKALV
jgi:hypothetical protein